MAPFVSKINTRRRIPKGDYTIDLAFTYSDGQEIATDQKAVTVHVTDFVEKHTMLINLVAIISTIVTVTGFALGFALPFVLSSLTSGSPAAPMQRQTVVKNWMVWHGQLQTVT
jgi:ABC-type Fe2+-enterobactin transport system substrate-binding protein